MGLPDDLERLAELRRRGDLTTVEYGHAKAQLLQAGEGPETSDGPRPHATVPSQGDPPYGAFAIAGLVLGLLSLLFWWMPVVPVFAIVLGGCGLLAVRRQELRGHAQASWAIALGALGLLLFLRGLML